MQQLRRTLAGGSHVILNLGRPATPRCAVAMATSMRFVHERPYFELPRDPAKGEAYEVARDALLQLNIMIRRGIEPDALMYTSLINIMGRAGLEWQAYKLFSRMVESNVRPLPETYVALRDATSRHRAALREEIQTKIEESISTFPEELAEDEVNRQREEDRQCVAKFEDYMRGVLPPPAAPPASAATHSGVQQTESAGDAHANTTSSNDTSAPVMTMSIRSPTDAWGTAQRAEEIRGRPQQMAAGEAAADLNKELQKLHEEELRIYLAANRQLRHGSKDQLISRVLTNIGESAIRAMLARRSHYFRSVEGILAADLEVVKRSQHSNAAANPVTETDRTMTAEESSGAGPDVLLTPWGMIRRPLKYRDEHRMAGPHATPAVTESQMERLEKVRLTAPELMLIRRRAESGDLDELPESLLRRYAFQFRLRWRRRVPSSLMDAVSWHATTFLTPNATAGDDDADAVVTSPPATPAIRLQKEKEGMQKTLENFDAFRIISQRTNNLQVVDDREINLHLKRIRRESLRAERKTEESLRRESNVMAAASLAASARSYTPPPDFGEEEPTHVLGLEGGENAMQARLAQNEGVEIGDETGVPPSPDHAPEARPDELPPWELTGGTQAFNMSTGRFGDPDEGQYQELSDSTIRVLPSRESQKQWSVDRHLLPKGVKDAVERAELEQLRYHDAVETEYKRRRQYAKYRKWDNMIQKAQDKAQAAEELEGGENAPIKPLPAKKRLAQLLRHGAERQKVSEALKAKYNKEL